MRSAEFSYPTIRAKESGASLEHIVTDRDKIIGQNEDLKPIAIGEHARSKLDAVPDLNLRQATAVGERVVSNAPYVRCDGDLLDPCMGERVCAD